MFNNVNTSITDLPAPSIITRAGTGNTTNTNTLKNSGQRYGWTWVSSGSVTIGTFSRKVSILLYFNSNDTSLYASNNILPIVPSDVSKTTTAYSNYGMGTISGFAVTGGYFPDYSSNRGSYSRTWIDLKNKVIKVTAGYTYYGSDIDESRWNTMQVGGLASATLNGSGVTYTFIGI